MPFSVLISPPPVAGRGLLLRAARKSGIDWAFMIGTDPWRISFAEAREPRCKISGETIPEAYDTAPIAKIPSKIRVYRNCARGALGEDSYGFRFLSEHERKPGSLLGSGISQKIRFVQPNRKRALVAQRYTCVMGIHNYTGAPIPVNETTVALWIVKNEENEAILIKR